MLNRTRGQRPLPVTRRAWKGGAEVAITYYNVSGLSGAAKQCTRCEYQMNRQIATIIADDHKKQQLM